MGQFRRFAALALLATLALASLPSVAAAAPPATDMWAIGSVDLADLAPGKAPTYIISLQLKKNVKLPAKVAVPIPDKITVLWVGEVFFGDPSQDINAEDAKIVKDGGRNYLTFTMKASRAVQVECTVPEAMLDDSGQTRKVNFHWVAPAIPGDVRLAVVVPTGYTAQTNPEGVQVRKAAEGAAYIRTYDKTKRDQRLELNLIIVPGEPTLTEESTEGSASATASAQASAAATASAPASLTLPPVPNSPTTDWPFIAVMVVVLGLLAAAVTALVMNVRKNKVSP